jgi:hypothetical protein
MRTAEQKQGWGWRAVGIVAIIAGFTFVGFIASIAWAMLKAVGLL